MNKKYVTLIISSIFIFSAIIVFYPIQADSSNTYQPQADGPYIADAWHEEENLYSVWDFEQVTGTNYKRAKPQAMLLTQNGTILFFQDVYLDGGVGGADMFVIKSFDNGSTWTYPALFINSNFELPAGYAWGPVPIDDSYGIHPNRTYLAVYGYDSPNSHHYIVYTEDNGATWVGVNDTHSITSEAIDLMDRTGVAPNSYYCLAGTSVITSSGRMILSVYHNQNILTFYSDDWYENGTSSSWTVSSEYGSGDIYSEGSIVETYNGSLFRIFRNNGQNNDEDHPHFSWSDTTDGIIAWKGIAGNKFPYITEFQEPTENMDLRRMTLNSSYEDNRIIFCWNNETYLADTWGRINVTVAVTNTECANWNYSRKVFDTAERLFHPRCFVTANKTIIASTYSWAEYISTQNNTLKLAKCNIEWLSQGWDTLNYTGGGSDTTPQFISINNNANGTTIYTSTPTFNWTLITGATMYCLQVSNNSVFTELVVNITDINEYEYPSKYSTNSTRVSFTLPDANALPTYKTYYCRVKALT